MSETCNDTAATIDHQEVHVDISSTNHAFQLDEGDDLEKGKSPSADSVKYNPASPHVAISQPGVPIIAQKPDPNRRPKDFILFSCFIIMGCNFIFGLIAYHFGTKSSWAWQLGDEAEAKKKSRRALIFCIIGLVVGVATWILVPTLYFTLGNRDHSVRHQTSVAG